MVVAEWKNTPGAPTHPMSPLHKCISDWLGNTSSGADSSWRVVNLGMGWAHKSSGNESCSNSSHTIPGMALWSGHCGDSRQCHGSGFHQQSGKAISRSLCQLTQEIFNWRETYMADLTVRYISGRQNTVADQLSCHNQIIPREWSLLPRVIEEICEVCGISIVSPIPDPIAWKGDIFQQSCKSLHIPFVCPNKKDVE